MTTLDTLRTDALYVPGIRFWGHAANHRYAIIAQNTNGAIELWHAMRDRSVGQVLAHSPKPIDGYDLTMECSILGGLCYSRESFIAYSNDFYPLLVAGEDQAVLKLLAEWHDETFAGRAVTA
jgi:hypothetical protein